MTSDPPFHGVHAFFVEFGNVRQLGRGEEKRDNVSLPHTILFYFLYLYKYYPGISDIPGLDMYEK